MLFTETKFKDAFIIEADKRVDERGFFARTWCKNEFEAHNLISAFVQCNSSFSKRKFTLRGLHYQSPPYQEAKLIRCIRGAIYDVIIDLRPDSLTYKQWLSVLLTADNRIMLYVPEDFAHGFQTIDNNTEVFYQVSQFYSPEYERGVRWDDPAFSIKWPQTDSPIISGKDKSWPAYLI